MISYKDTDGWKSRRQTIITNARVATTMNNTMKIATATLLMSLVSAPVAMAQSVAQIAVNRAGEVIDGAIEVYGGAAALADLKSVSMNIDSENSAVGQSRKPGEPLDRNKTSGRTYIDFENKVFVTRTSGTGGGNEFDFGTTINGENSFNINYLNKLATPLAEPDFNTSSGPFVRITSALLVKQLQERRQTSHWLGTEDIDGKPHDVITLVMEVGPGLSLYFDQETKILTKSERVLPPFGSVGYRFRDHKMIGGILFNRSFELLVNDVNNMDRINRDIAVNQTQKGITEVPAGYRIDEPQMPDQLSSNKIDEGVYFVGGGGTYTLFVEMSDYIFAAGATGGVADRIAELRKFVPNKPIRYALITHHHNDHIPGSADYSAAGATLLTVAANKSVVQAAAGSETAKLEFVEGVRKFDDGNRAFEVRNIGPTPHAENLLVVYLPKEGIVFEADHFSLPLNGTLPPTSKNTRAFASAVNDWDFTRLVGAHSPGVASKADLLNVVSGELSAR